MPKSQYINYDQYNNLNNSELESKQEQENFINSNIIEYSISDKITKEDFDKVYKFAMSIVVKDEEEARDYETDASAENSVELIRQVEDGLIEVEYFNPEVEIYSLDSDREIIYDDAGNPITEVFNEINYYYERLLLGFVGEDGNIHQPNPYVIRVAEDGAIINYDPSIMTEGETAKFIEIYQNSLRYYKRILYNKAFSQEQLFNWFSKTIVLFMAMERFLSVKSTDVNDIDIYDSSMIRNLLNSYGLNDLADGEVFYRKNIYQYRILKKFNDLIKYKGSKNVIDIILDIFNYKNDVEIKKYILAKSIKDSDVNLRFYEIDYNNANLMENLPNSPSEGYTSFLDKTSEDSDETWLLTENDADNLDFNYIPTKYLSLINRSRIDNGIIMVSYLYNLLKDVDSEDSTLNENITLDIDVYSNYLSLFSEDTIEDISLYDVILGITHIINMLKYLNSDSYNDDEISDFSGYKTYGINLSNLYNFNRDSLSVSITRSGIDSTITNFSNYSWYTKKDSIYDDNSYEMTVKEILDFLHDVSDNGGSYIGYPHRLFYNINQDEIKTNPDNYTIKTLLTIADILKNKMAKTSSAVEYKLLEYLYETLYIIDTPSLISGDSIISEATYLSYSHEDRANLYLDLIETDNLKLYITPTEEIDDIKSFYFDRMLELTDWIEASFDHPFFENLEYASLSNARDSLEFLKETLDIFRSYTTQIKTISTIPTYNDVLESVNPKEYLYKIINKNIQDGNDHGDERIFKLEESFKLYEAINFVVSDIDDTYEHSLSTTDNSIDVYVHSDYTEYTLSLDAGTANATLSVNTITKSNDGICEITVTDNNNSVNTKTIQVTFSS
jgi:hypothetical protein